MSEQLKSKSTSLSPILLDEDSNFKVAILLKMNLCDSGKFVNLIAIGYDNPRTYAIS